MANEKNLKPFPPGNNANPKGRPKGSLNRSTIAKKWLEVMQDSKNPISGEIEKLSQADLMTLALIHKARKGDVSAYKQLMDSAFGLPQQNVNVTEEKPIFPGIDLDVE
jgi:hypothetical protein